MLHLKCLEDLTLPLKCQDADSCLIQLPPASLRVLMLSQGMEYVLDQQYLTLAVDLVDEAVFVELNAHAL